MNNKRKMKKNAALPLLFKQLFILSLRNYQMCFWRKPLGQCSCNRAGGRAQHSKRKEQRPVEIYSGAQACGFIKLGHFLLYSQSLTFNSI
jgi:hypothetical protein